MFVRRVYRMLLKSCQKTIFEKQNHEFLVATLDIFQQDLDRLSFNHSSNSLVPKFSKNPRQTLRKCFKEGQPNDLDVLMSVLPRLLRYIRAAKLIVQCNNIFPEQSRSSFYRRKTIDNILNSPYNMTAGALLVSKMFYNEAELHARDVDTIYRDWLEATTDELKTELELVIEDRRNMTRLLKEIYPDLKFFRGGLIEKRRKRVFPVLVALDNLIRRKENERLRDRSNDYEHLVDQVIHPDTVYDRAMPITYSVIYCALVNALEVELHAFGIGFPKNFLSRILVKNTSNATNNLLQAEKDYALARGGSIKGKMSNVEKVNVFTLPGNWVVSAESRFFEVVLRYDHNNHMLEAMMVFSHASLPVKLWQLDLSTLESPNHVNCNVEYEGTIYRKGLEEKEPVPLPCSIKFTVPNVNVINSLSKSKVPYTGSFLEIIVKFKAPIDLAAELGGLHVEELQGRDLRSNSQQLMEWTNFYCRMEDLDCCLLEMSDKGVALITPTEYIASLKR